MTVVASESATERRGNGPGRCGITVVASESATERRGNGSGR